MAKIIKLGAYSNENLEFIDERKKGKKMGKISRLKCTWQKEKF